MLQGKGKKRQLGWFPASYVKMMESAGEKSDVPVQSVSATSEAAKPVENIETESNPNKVVDPSAMTKVKTIFIR